MSDNINMELNQLVDPNYADLIVDNNYVTNLHSYVTQVLNLNYRYSVINVPSYLLNECSTGLFPYYIFPKCYTLQSERALAETGVTQIQSNPSFSLYGSGTLIAIIDTGIDYQNSIFRKSDGTTRIKYIWDQTINDNDKIPNGFYFGSEYDEYMINDALLSNNPLDIVPSIDTNGHGTALAGVAGGSKNIKEKFTGVASNAEFIIIKLKFAKEITKSMFNIPIDVECYQETDIIFAIKYAILKANYHKMPISICIALGTNQGPHSGREPLDSYLSYLSQFRGICISVAAGNEANNGRHYFGRSIISEYKEFELKVGENDKLFSIEIWQNVAQRLSIEIISPTGERTPIIYPNIRSCHRHNFIFEPTVLIINNIIVENILGEQLILLKFQNAIDGIWRFRIYNINNRDFSFNAWLPVGNMISKETFFIEPEANTTITSPGNAVSAITFGAYNPENGVIWVSSGRGYNTFGIISPDLVSPGINIRSPMLDGGFDVYTGTGIATAFATGIIAMILEWGIVRGNLDELNGVEIRELLMRGANRRVDVEYPNNISGYGEINIYGFFDNLRI